MKFLNKLIETIQHDILGSDNRFIAMTWLVCLTGLILMGFYLSSESRSFLGVADSREQQISFEYPVSIKEINVLSGQSVRKGDLMMELDQSELREKIRYTKVQLARLLSERSLRTQLNKIVSNSVAGDLADPLSVDIDDLQDQLANLEQQKKNLYVFAQVDGIVGGVNYKKGEKVPAFTSILTLSPDSPTYIEGFLHESLRTKLEVGKFVKVQPLSTDTASVEGKIVSVGSRIVLIPPRLASYPNMQVYGREVVVEIPPHSGFLLGEKVQIKPRFEFMTLQQATAAAKNKNSPLISGVTTDPAEMTVPTSMAKSFSFEPSGVVYLEDLKKYLVISDDTDKDKSATLFLVNSSGVVDDQTLTIPNIKVSDLESISQQDGYIYLLSSQGLNKKGKDKKNRNQLIRVHRSGLNLNDVKVVDFKPLLMASLKGSKNKDLQKLAKSQKEFEIEGHFVKGADLYLGLKGPLLKEQAVVLKVQGFASLFDKNTLSSNQVALWNTVNFKSDKTGAPHKISDLISYKEKIYATTVCAEEDCGAVWHLAEENGALSAKLIKFYSGVKPEGLAFDPKQSVLFVTFDEKEDVALFAKVEVK